MYITFQLFQHRGGKNISNFFVYPHSEPLSIERAQESKQREPYVFTFFSCPIRASNFIGPQYKTGHRFVFHPLVSILFLPKAKKFSSAGGYHFWSAKPF